MPPSYLKSQECWLHSLTRITYSCKLIGMSFFAAYLQLQLLWVIVFSHQPNCPLAKCFTRRLTSSCLPALNGRASGLPR
ncbi:hypothetical protein B4901_19710 [Yersinia frederiksenii]|nr:hypothetical protein B4901_19710 [Yersinia frederiksenii]